MEERIREDVFQINGNVYMTNHLLSSFLCQRYPQHIFVYGDNHLGRGKRGQAIIRDEPNTIGLTTKWYPHNGEQAFFSDDDPHAERILKFSLLKIKDLVDEGKSIVLSSQGYGNGYAQLPVAAPKLFKLLCDRLNTLCGKVIYQ